MISTFLLFWYAAGLALVGLHCRTNDRLTLCDFLFLVMVGGIFLASLCFLAGVVVYLIMEKYIYLIVISSIYITILCSFSKFPKIDIRKFCVVLWRKQ